MLTLEERVPKIAPTSSQEYASRYLFSGYKDTSKRTEGGAVLPVDGNGKPKHTPEETHQQLPPKRDKQAKAVSIIRSMLEQSDQPMSLREIASDPRLDVIDSNNPYVLVCASLRQNPDKLFEKIRKGVYGLVGKEYAVQSQPEPEKPMPKEHDEPVHGGNGSIKTKSRPHKKRYHRVEGGYVRNGSNNGSNGSGSNNGTVSVSGGNGKKVKTTASSKRGNATDLELVNRAKEGDLVAFEDLMGAYRNLVGRIIYDRVYDVHITADLIQVTFLKAYKSLRTLKEGNKFKGWVASIARNTIIDHFRKNKVTPTSLDEFIDEGLDPPDPVHRWGVNEFQGVKEETREVILTAIRKLPPIYGQIIKLRHLNDMTYKQMAKQIHSPVATVESRLYRARLLLREVLDRELV